MTTRQIPEIKASEVRDLLKNGVTRFKADDEGFGSIEEKYNLTQAGVRRLFQNEELKGLKTIVPEFTYINDIPAEEVLEEEEAPQPLVERLAEITPEEYRENVAFRVSTGQKIEEEAPKEEKKEVSVFE